MPNASGVYVQGLAEVRRWVATFEPNLRPVLRDELKRAANTTVRPAVSRRVPKRSGSAAGSVRAVSRGNTVQIVAGSRSVPYFGWLDFGGTLRPVGKRHNTIKRPKVKGGRYMYPGVAESSGELVDAAGHAVDRVLRLANR